MTKTEEKKVQAAVKNASTFAGSLAKGMTEEQKTAFWADLFRQVQREHCEHETFEFELGGMI